MTEVIERIKAKEIERGKEKRNVPELRFRGFEDEWEEKRLGEILICLDNMRKPLNSSERQKMEGDIPYYGANGVVDYINDFIFDEKLILLAEDGGNFDEFADRPIAQLIGGKSWVNNHAHVLRVYNDCIEYIFYTLVHKDIRKYINGSSRAKLNKADMLDIKIKITCLEEQVKIAIFLSTIDRKIEKQSEKVEALKTYQKGIMQKIFKQEIRFKDENGREYPEWENIQLDRICNIKKGEQINKLNLSLIGKYYVLNGGVSYSGFTDRYNTEENTISISEGGNSCGYVNFNNNKFWSGGHCYTLLNLSSNIIVRYLYNYLKFKEKQIMNLRVGSGLPNIQKNALSALSITLPCFKEQTKIATFLSTIDKKIEKEEKKLEKLKVYKKGLLQKMFV